MLELYHRLKPPCLSHLLPKMEIHTQSCPCGNSVTWAFQAFQSVTQLAPSRIAAIRVLQSAIQPQKAGLETWLSRWCGGCEPQICATQVKSASWCWMIHTPSDTYMSILYIYIYDMFLKDVYRHLFAVHWNLKHFSNVLAETFAISIHESTRWI